MMGSISKNSILYGMCYTCLDNLNVINQWAAQFMLRIRTPLLDKVMLYTTNIASPVNIWMLCLVLVLILWLHKKYHHIVQFLASMILTTGAVYAIKLAVKLQRPTGGLISESGYSFASGHAAFAMMFFLLTFYAYKVHITSLFVRKIFLLMSVCAAILVGFSRVYLGVHYMTDVLMGFFLGVTVFALSVLLLDSYERAHNVLHSGK